MATAILTQQRLHMLLNYSPDTGVFVWRVRRSTARAGDVAGTICAKGYRRIFVDGRPYSAARLAWLWAHGEWWAGEIDHINRQRDDNRIANLRKADRFVNTQNTSQRKDNRSGYRGVGWHKISGKWRARISVNGRAINLGSFNDKNAAIAAYEAAARQYHAVRFSATLIEDSREASPANTDMHRRHVADPQTV